MVAAAARIRIQCKTEFSGGVAPSSAGPKRARIPSPSTAIGPARASSSDSDPKTDRTEVTGRSFSAMRILCLLVCLLRLHPSDSFIQTPNSQKPFRTMFGLLCGRASQRFDFTKISLSRKAVGSKVVLSATSTESTKQVELSFQSKIGGMIPFSWRVLSFSLIQSVFETQPLMPSTEPVLL